MKRLLSYAPLAIGICLVPQVALACPYCAGRGISPALGALIGGLLLMPYLIGWTVIRFVRRISSDLGSPGGPAVPPLR